MAVTARARELENSLAESACAIDQPRQGMTGYLPDTDSYQTIPSQALYRNTLSGMTGISVPVAESTPVPQGGPTLIKPIPTHRAHDILEPIASEQVRAKYLDEQMRHMKSVQPPLSIPASDDILLEEDNLSKRIQEYCLRIEDHQRCEKDTHYVTLNSIKEYKARQRQQGRKDRDEVYQKMSQHLEKVREVARNTFSKASTILAEEHRMNLSETDSINIKEKMNKIDQRIDGLYQNWQVEYKEAITTEQGEEIQRFYEPYVRKYETKYKILYQMLRQAISDRSRIPSSKVSSTGLTPSLVALEDASTLKRKEWSRGEPGEDIPHMYSTIDGKLTPTAPVYEDMRMETPLHVTPEESLEGLSAAIGGVEDSTVTQQATNNTKRPESHVVSPDIAETCPKVIQERLNQEELPGRNEVTRENSREDALATTRHFFHIVTEERNVPEVPITSTVPEVPTTSTASVSQMDTPSTPSVQVETEPAEKATTSARMYLPSGSPPRPTATATCRPQTWVQCVSEGQIEEPLGDDDHSEEGMPLEPLVLEGLPDELGPEWRVLHPFEIPGVRFPTEDTPHTHRRLAENDALVELIQAAEYLEDAPSWGQRRFYPPQNGDPYYRG